MGRRTLLLFALLGSALAACDAPRRYQAAEDVHAFLQAVHDGDRQAFEAHVDRAALKAQLRGEATKAAAGFGFGGPDVQAFLGGPQGDVILDQMISPESFRMVWKRSGVPADRTPTAAELVVLTRMLAPDRACVHDLKTPDECALTFKDEGGTWKLVQVARTGIGEAAPAAS